MFVYEHVVLILISVCERAIYSAISFSFVKCDEILANFVKCHGKISSVVESGLSRVVKQVWWYVFMANFSRLL